MNMHNAMQVLRSQMDASVNFVEAQLVGFLESRYVRRESRYFVAYLSSQTGCNRGCRMCHLTVTRQTQFQNADLTDFVQQYDTILHHYAQDTPAPLVHINWMARGEPLANPTVTETSTELFGALAQKSREYGLIPKFNMSTIMPVTMRKSLVQAFPVITPTIYYSMYSVNPDFRRKWLPAAMNVDQALDLLHEYQYVSKKIIKFHGAFIAGENDSLDDVRAQIAAIQARGLRAEYNIVRYNPYSSEQGTESTRLDEIHMFISEYMPCKIISRVGTDVAASCGTFIQ
jgi:adenine C2-methylase RlmN of 23S rRNA A2503 and tRNA A37